MIPVRNQRRRDERAGKQPGCTANCESLRQQTEKYYKHTPSKGFGNLRGRERGHLISRFRRTEYRPAPPQATGVYGTLYLLRPQSAEAKKWVEENLGCAEEPQWFGDAVVVESRYISPIVAGLKLDGLEVLLGA